MSISVPEPWVLCSRPGVNRKASGRPWASQRACSLVLKPPRERPRASACCVRCYAGCAMVRPDIRAVDHVRSPVPLTQLRQSLSSASDSRDAVRATIAGDGRRALAALNRGTRARRRDGGAGHGRAAMAGLRAAHPKERRRTLVMDTTREGRELLTHATVDAKFAYVAFGGARPRSPARAIYTHTKEKLASARRRSARAARPSGWATRKRPSAVWVGVREEHGATTCSSTG